MNPNLQHLASAALELEEDARARLAAILLDSLDESGPLDTEADRRTLQEADRRDRELASGSVQGRSWEQVLSVARARLR